MAAMKGVLADCCILRCYYRLSLHAASSWVHGRALQTVNNHIGVHLQERQGADSRVLAFKTKDCKERKQHVLM